MKPLSAGCRKKAGLPFPSQYWNVYYYKQHKFLYHFNTRLSENF
jgi:hypothetical protein